MPLQRIQSFKAKFTALVTLTSTAAVVLTCAVVVVIGYFASRDRAIRSLTTEGDMIAIHSTAALMFKDPAAGTETLAALKAEPDIAAAVMFTPDGAPFARYERDAGASKRLGPGQPGEPGRYFDRGWLVRRSAITQDEQNLGTLVLMYDMSRSYARLRFSALSTLAVGALATLAAYLASLRLQRVLVRPIANLMGAAHKIGQTRDYSIRVPRDAPDELGQFTDAFNDMIGQIQRQSADLEKAREWFQVAVDSAPNAMVMVDGGGRIVLVNTQTEKLFGYTRQEMAGEKIEMLVPERFRPAHPAHREGFFASPRARSMGEGRDLFGRRRDGTEFPVEIGLNPIESDKGLMVLSAIVDITERKRAEEKLHRANRELRSHNQQMEQFVYTVSHDLKSPLVTAAGFVGLLTESLAEGNSQEVLEAAGHIKAAVTKMSLLIKDLLELGRIGKVREAPQEIDVQALVTELGAEMAQRFQKVGAKLVIQDSIPRVFADRTRVGQVFENLLSNAIKYAADGPNPIFTVGGESLDGEVRLFVRDNGPGIAPEHHRRIFGLFQRLDTHHEGTGVGLAIVAQVAEVHGGRAWVESSPGQGATFWVAFPMQPPAVADAA